MSVIAFVDGSSCDASVIRHAAWAATAIDQSVNVVAQENPPERQPAIPYDAYQQMDPREDIFRELASQPQVDYADSDTATVEIVQNAARRIKDLGVGRVRTIITSDPLPYFIETVTDSDDLLVVARKDSSGASARHLDQFLKAQGRMMLLVPETYAPIESWMIAIDGKPAIGRAVDFLSRRSLLREQVGKAVIVGNDYQSRIHFRDAVRHLESCGHNITSHELQGNADDVLAAVLEISPVDMLVMGAYGQGRFRLLTERSTTSRLLKSFNGPILVAKA